MLVRIADQILVSLAILTAAAGVAALGMMIWVVTD